MSCQPFLIHHTFTFFFLYLSYLFYIFFIILVFSEENSKFYPKYSCTGCYIFNNAYYLLNIIDDKYLAFVVYAIL